MGLYPPVYLDAYESGLLKDHTEQAWMQLSDCCLCPRNCHANRLSGESGDCNTATYAWVSSHGPHFGEEPPLTGFKGSGTIFFTHCNLNCLFCQNYDISHQGQGRQVSDQELARMMLNLQEYGCHNINFVSPSHVVPQLLKALEISVNKGLTIPLVYNTGSYDKVKTLKLLDGIVDIYMPDLKFLDPGIAEECCQAADYPEICMDAIKEMHSQAGDLIIENDVAVKGLIIRHLVMPQDYSTTRECLEFIANEISKNSYVNIMPQYRPCGEAYKIPALSGRLLEGEYAEALRIANEVGLTRLAR